jgi:hypothetical protein
MTIQQRKFFHQQLDLRILLKEHRKKPNGYENDTIGSR